MKYLDGTDVMKGDVALVSTPDGTVIAGTVHQLMDRTEQILVSNYPLRVYSRDALLASACYKAVAGPVLERERLAKEQALKEAAEKVEAERKAAEEAAKAPQTNDIQTPPAQSSAS